MAGRPISLAVLAVAAAVAAPAPAPAEPPAEWPVTVQTVADRKAVFATVESVDVTLARARIGGTIEALSVDEGSAVEAGQRIAAVHDPKIAPRLAALAARIDSLGAERELAWIELDRARELYKKGTVSKARLDDALTAHTVVTANIAALEAERAVVLQQQAEGAVLAPASGRVLEVHVTGGSVVLPGDVVATIAAESYVLRMHLPERHARFIEVGDTVLVGGRGLAAEDRPLGEGRVRQVYPEMEQGRVVADVDVAGLGDFFVGERTRVYVATGTREAVVVPPAFLYVRHGLTYARLKEGGETVVQTGLPAEGGVEVLSGLAPGDVLVRP